MKRVNLLAAGIFVLGQALSGTAVAAPVTLAGSTVDFTFDDALLGLFGPATVSGDTLFFTPVDFKAQSLNGSGFALASQTVNIKISAHDGWQFSSVDLSEKGDYLLMGSAAAVDVGGQMRVFDIAKPLMDVTTHTVVLPPYPLVEAGFPTHDWTAQSSIDLASWEDSRAINVTVENLLLASSFSSGSLAFIEKKFAGLNIETVSVTPVPEAETWAMMLAGLGLVGWTAMRRRQQQLA